MSVLFWLFGLGALAIAFPFLFHLIRRQPQGQMEFSSLMFLRPTPPRISRRSRIDNWLLLLLRCLVLVLIAFAFMRPFLPDNASLLQDNTVARRVAILVDTSASMRRVGVWPEVQSKIDSLVDSFEPQDQLALFHFDQQTHTLVDFDAASNRERADTAADIKQSIQSLTPSWMAGNLSAALTSVVNQLLQINDVEMDQAGVSQLQIVLVSDMQEPADLQTLQMFQWPEAVKLELLPIEPAQPATSDARVSLVAASSEPSDTDTPSETARLRVSNVRRSQEAGFEISWTGIEPRPDSDYEQPVSPARLPLQVPPGTVQTVEIPEDFSRGLGSFQLSGDSDLFGNQFYAATPQLRKLRLIALSNQGMDNPSTSLFYLKHALPQSANSQLELNVYAADQSEWIATIQSETPGENVTDCVAILIERPLEERENEAIQTYLQQGGRLILKLDDAETAEQLQELGGYKVAGSWAAEDEKVDYLLLGDLDFRHWTLAPFQQLGFNDFTRIHFWQATAIEFPEDQQIQIAAKFDNNLPAIWEKTYADHTGSIVGITFDWQPERSQFALSSKFVPWVGQLVGDPSAGQTPVSYWLGQPLPLPSTMDENWKVEALAGETTGLEMGAAQLHQSGDDPPWLSVSRPGIYSAKQDEQPIQYFAVNVHPDEFSDHLILDQQFETVGIPLGRHPSESEQLQQERLKKDVELEEGQKLWKYLVAASLFLLIAEMGIAGKTARQIQESSAT